MGKHKTLLRLFVIVIMAIATGCDKSKDLDHRPKLAGPAKYEVTLTSPNGTCVQTIKKNGLQLPGSYNWVEISATNQDEITWITGYAVDSITFPSNNGSSTWPGTPFSSYTIKVGTSSGAATLLPQELNDFYFPYAVNTINNNPCSFTLQGMGVHVTK